MGVRIFTQILNIKYSTPVSFITVLGPSTRVGRSSLTQQHNQQLKQQQQHSILQQQQVGVDDHQFTRPAQPPVQPVRKFSGIARPSAPSTRMGPGIGGRPSTAGAPGTATRLPAPGSR